MLLRESRRDAGAIASEITESMTDISSPSSKMASLTKAASNSWSKFIVTT